jgi:hypothetical protein
MVLRHYLPPKLVVFHYDQATVMPPMVVLGQQRKAHRQFLDLVSESILRYRDLLPQGMGRNLAGKEAIREHHYVFIIPRTIIKVRSA